MVRGYAEHPGGRHHGAHGEVAADALGKRPANLLDFSQNINPLGPPPGAIEAARRAISTQATSYPPPDYPELRDALGAYLGVSPELVVPTNGGAGALFLAARAVDRAGSRALVPEPTFSEYAAAARAAHLTVKRRLLRTVAADLRPHPQAVEDLDGLAAVFLCNPNNPTGDALSAPEVRRVVDRARDAGAAVILDEAFADFAPETSIVADVDDALYVARSFTKFFAIPGLRIGALVCADPERVRALQPSWPVNAAAAAAATVAARDAEFAGATLREVSRLRGDLSAALAELPRLRVYPSATNFLLFRGPGGIPERLARRGILVRGCGPYEGLDDRFVRVAVRPENENERLVSALKEEL